MPIRLNPPDRGVFNNLLEEFLEAGMTQAQIADLADVLPSDLSNLKRGVAPVNEEKWNKLLEFFHKQIVNDNIKISLDSNLRIRDALGRLQKPRPSQEKISMSSLGVEELRRAYDAFEMNKLLNPGMWEIRESKYIWTARSDYTDIPAIEKMQRKLEAFVVTEGAPSVQIKESAPHTGTIDSYVRVVNWDSAQTSRLLCLFPFFLTSDRRFWWGVIPYARLTHIGLALPSHIANVLHLENDAEMTGETFKTLLNDYPLRFNYLVGYSQYAIVKEMVVKFKNVDLLDKFETSTTDPCLHLREAANNLGKSSNVICLYDLGEKSKLQKAIDVQAAEGPLDPHVHVRLKHGIEVPVGIGFSLQALQWVVAHGRARKLAQIAWEALSFDDNIGKSVFGSVGITLYTKDEFDEQYSPSLATDAGRPKLTEKMELS